GARRERLLGSCYDDAADRFGRFEGVDRMAQVRNQRRVERVERLGAIEADDADAPAGLDLDVLVGHGALLLVCLLDGSLLAHGTKKRGTAILRHPPRDAGADARRAAAAFAIIDPELVLEASEFAVGAAVIAQRGPARPDPILEH